MMLYINLLVISLLGIIGLYFGMLGFKEYRNITRTADKVSVSHVIKIATVLGMSSSLLFFTIVILGGIVNNEYIWDLKKLGGSIIVSLILGIVVMLGGAYQIYTTVIFRDLLIRKYKVKDKSDNGSQ